MSPHAKFVRADCTPAEVMRPNSASTRVGAELLIGPSKTVPKKPLGAFRAASAVGAAASDMASRQAAISKRRGMRRLLLDGNGDPDHRREAGSGRRRWSG